jgi:drug/metabolite transporter (DMT)-like permease
MHAYVYALLTAVFWGSSTTLGKIVITHNSHLYTLALKFLCTGLIGWIIVYFSHEMMNPVEIVTRISTKPIHIIFLIFISDILATGVYYRSLRDMPATIATILELAFPLTGFILDYMLYDVIPSSIKVVAAFTILISIVILPHCHFIEEKSDNFTLMA